jgi:hypothetical protein
LRKPEGIGRTEFQSFKRRALQYAVADGTYTGEQAKPYHSA